MNKLLSEATAFLWQVLHLVLPLLWWALAGLIMAGANLFLLDEVWPNTPSAARFFILLACGCGMVAGWAIPVTIHAIYRAVKGFFWHFIWGLLWGGSVIGGIGLIILCGVGGIINFSEWTAT